MNGRVLTFGISKISIKTGRNINFSFALYVVKFADFSMLLRVCMVIKTGIGKTALKKKKKTYIALYYTYLNKWEAKKA